MLIKKLVLDNFLSHKQTSVEFKDNLILLSGNNGAGKSAILDAILFLLFKRARLVDARGSNAGSLINDGAVSMGLSMDFELNNKEYCVKAQKKGNASVVHNLYENSKLVVGKSCDTVDYIQSILNMDYDTFAASVFLVQGDSDFFLSCKSNERKQIFSRVLGLNIYEELEKFAKLERREWTQKHEGVTMLVGNKEVELKQIRRELDGCDSFNLVSDRVEQLKKAYQNSCAASASLKAEIEKTRSVQIVDSELTVLRSRIGDAKRMIRDAFNKLKQIEAVTDTEELIKKRSKLESEVDEIQKEHDALLAKRERLFGLRQGFSKTLTQITSLEEKCPLCLSEISEIKKTELAKEFQAKLDKAEELGVLLQQKISENQSLLAARNEEVDSHTKQIERQAAAKNFEGTQRMLANTLVKQLKEYEEKEVNLQSEFKQSQELEIKRVWYEKEVKKQRELEEKLEQQVKLQNHLEELKKRVLDIEIDLASQQSSLKQAQSEVAYYDKIAKASNEQGIPTLLINTVLPQFCDEANRILQILTKGQFLVDFSLDNEKKSMDCNVKLRSGANRLYELCSGGERFKIDLAIRLALSFLLAKRSGTKIDTIFIDEGAGCLDSESREFFIDLLNYAKTKFKRVLVITHIDELKERFNNVLEFEKTKGVSKVKYANKRDF